jgi:hypothetical protein
MQTLKSNRCSKAIIQKFRENVLWPCSKRRARPSTGLDLNKYQYITISSKKYFSNSNNRMFDRFNGT